MGVGPGRIAKVLAYGEIGKATATSRWSGDQICYRVLLPVALTFEVDLQIEKQLYKAELLVPLTLTAVALSGLRIFIEAEPPRPDEVQVELEAQGIRASMLQRVADVEGELRRFVARYVAKELDKPAGPRGAYDRRVECDRSHLGLDLARIEAPATASPPT